MQNAHRLPRTLNLQAHHNAYFSLMGRAGSADKGNVDVIILHWLGDIKLQTGKIIHIDLDSNQARFTLCRFTPTELH